MITEGFEMTEKFNVSFRGLPEKSFCSRSIRYGNYVSTGLLNRGHVIGSCHRYDLTENTYFGGITLGRRNATSLYTDSSMMFR